MQTVLWTTVLMGTACAIHAGWLCYQFTSVSRPGARAVRWMLFGETISMCVFVWFSYLEANGEILDLSPLVASIMRWICFAATLGSTIHLRIMINEVDRRIANGDHIE